MAYHLSLETDPNEQDIQTLRNRLAAHNIARAQIDQGEEVAIFLRDEADQLVGGVLGFLWGGCLEIDFLWVADSLRGQGYGSHLLTRLEAYALERGCLEATLDTYSFQAPDFYRKHGYHVLGYAAGYPDQHKKFYMRKVFPR